MDFAGVLLEIEVETQSKVPIYVRIEEQVKSMLAAGQLHPVDQLPTIRQLAADLRVNYNTVARAYLDLDRNGVITTQRGRGSFVAGTTSHEQMLLLALSIGLALILQLLDANILLLAELILVNLVGLYVLLSFRVANEWEKAVVLRLVSF